jgi:hypothetical protein
MHLGPRSFAFPLMALTLASAHCGSNGAPASESPPADAGPQDDAAPSPPLTPGGGFVELASGVDGANFRSRMFYSFQPAADDAGKKPLFLFFNGGPGWATSSLLRVYGTGPVTIDLTLAPSPPIRNNPSTFARFANLLYVDERSTGFSYGLTDIPNFPLAFAARAAIGPQIASADCAQFSVVEDAFDFLRVLLAFWDEHPRLEAAPVVVVGESYGGTRAEVLLHAVLHYADDDPALPSDLRDALQRHFEAVFGPTGGAAFEPQEIARQFGRSVLIQPFMLGEAQEDLRLTLIFDDPYLGPIFGQSPPRDAYDLRQDADNSSLIARTEGGALADHDLSRALIGFDLEDASLLLPASRKNAFRLSALQTQDDVAINSLMTERFGALSAGDDYFRDAVQVCVDGPTMNDVRFGNYFLSDLRYVRSLITNARYDGVVYGPSIVGTLPNANLDTTPRNGEARPGRIHVSVPASGSDPATTAEIRFPNYDDSGHFVTVTQGADLADDVAAWLAEP